MNIYSTTLISTNSSIFSVFMILISSLFMFFRIVQSMDSGGSPKARELNLSTDLDKKFHERIVVPMVRICTQKQFGIFSNGNDKDESVNVCANIRLWNALYSDPPNATFLYRIRRDSKLDTEHLAGRYVAALNVVNNAEQIRNEVQQMAEKRLIVTFRTTYERFKKEAANYNGHTSEMLIEFEKLVYKLLCIGLALLERKVIKEAEGKQALAYKQYAINLAIHSLHIHIEHPISVDLPGEIQKVSKNWMKIDGKFNSLNGIHKRFYGTVVVPLVRTCDWHFGYNFEEDKFVCEKAKDLQKLFLEWDNQQQKSAKNKNMSEEERNIWHNEIANIWAQIRYAINFDREGLKNLYYAAKCRVPINASRERLVNLIKRCSSFRYYTEENFKLGILYGFRILNFLKSVLDGITDFEF